jgi:mannose-1-phosphate guanylyltransferase
MAGGSGSRLWPLSREFYPKQFLKITSSLSLIQETIQRANGITAAEPIIICNNAHRFLMVDQLANISMKSRAIILEPCGRNTAPAVALAAFKLLENNMDDLLLVLAADHEIKDQQSFEAAVKVATPLAESGKLVTFGIVPTHPETGYGYIKQGESVDQNNYSFAVECFVEKPNQQCAQNYLREGGYHWNSGMFLLKASRYLEELMTYRPDIYDACSGAMLDAKNDLDFIRPDEKQFEQCPSESIDYAVMEKTRDAVVVPMDIGWSDVGSWSSLWDISNKDANGNALCGDILQEGSKNCYIHSQNRLVATVGVENLVVVETKDALLVADKDKVQDVKCIVNRLKNAQRKEYIQHQDVYRPWGNHEQIAEGSRYHVKKVTVNPGQKTATQIHYHRAEHWIVVSGTAKVTNGKESYLVSENESTYIPLGAPHSFENPGHMPLELIEVRTGSYLEEDDIVRLDSEGEGY